MKPTVETWGKIGNLTNDSLAWDNSIQIRLMLLARNSCEHFRWTNFKVIYAETCYFQCILVASVWFVDPSTIRYIFFSRWEFLWNLVYADGSGELTKLMFDPHNFNKCCVCIEVQIRLITIDCLHLNGPLPLWIGLVSCFLIHYIKIFVLNVELSFFLN